MKRTKLMVVALVPALVAGGAGLANATTGDRTASAARQSYDAHTLFKGLLFGQGPAARVVPEFTGSRQQFTPAQSAAIDQVIKVLEQRHPGTVASVKAAVQSGSEPRIKAAITQASENLGQVLTPQSTNAPVRNDQQRIILALAVVVVAAVHTVAWKWKWKWSAAEQNNRQLTELQKDKFVHQVATRLS